MNSKFSRVPILSVAFALVLAVAGQIATASAQTFYNPDATTAAAPPEEEFQGVDPGQPVPPAEYVMPQVQTGLPECPVPYYDLMNTLRGIYGVDALGRPVNPYGFPVDEYGNCLTLYPVTEVFNAEPNGVYVGFLYRHWGYRYVYRTGFVRIVPFGGSSIVVYRNYGRIPVGRPLVTVRGWSAPPASIIVQNRTTIQTIAPARRPGLSSTGTYTGPSAQGRPNLPAAPLPAANQPGLAKPPALPQGAPPVPPPPAGGRPALNVASPPAGAKQTIATPQPQPPPPVRQQSVTKAAPPPPAKRK